MSAPPKIDDVFCLWAWYRVMPQEQVIAANVDISSTEAFTADVASLGIAVAIAI